MYSLDTYADPTRQLQDSDDAELGDFFSRPLKIAEYEWSDSITFGEDLNPWALFFDNPRVNNRITNFNLLRAKLHVKIMINGTQFHYGRILAAYEPLAFYNQLAPVTTLIRQDLVRASQLPHVFLDPCASEGGEMELPFFWHYNYLKIPQSEWSNMGTLYLRELNALKQSNGGQDPVTISVFAWATDVEVSVLTSLDSNVLEPQAGENKKTPKTSSGKTPSKTKNKAGMSKPKNTEQTQANTQGMVSGPATAVAKVAGALKVVPWLTPFATATEMAANTTASIAKLFGYSRPTVTVDPEPFKPHIISDLATTTVPDGATKLTVDDKQELSLDTRIAGIGAEDPLSIKSIAERESYLTTFTWSQTDAPEKLLWNSRVVPTLWAESGTTTKALHMPACCVAALPFEFWTGSMTFRFQIVKSNFHKGRIKLVYDPQVIDSVEYNTNYLHVVDITEKTDFSITIGNGQARTLLNRYNPQFTDASQLYGTDKILSTGVANGLLALYVVNKLTAPVTDAPPIEVNVFVKMEDDFETFVPIDDIANLTLGNNASTRLRRAEVLDAQSGEVDMAENKPPGAPTYAPDELENAPLHEKETCNLGPGMQDNDLINKVYTGEAIESFRPLLKRYALWNAIGTIDTSPTVIAFRWAAFPYYRGYMPGAVNTDDTSGAPYNFCNTTLLHYITRCYAGWRGSTRWKFLPRGEIDTLTAYVQRHPELADGGGDYNFTITTPNDPVNEAARSQDIVKGTNTSLKSPPIGINGQAYRYDSINPAMEFEMPFYNDRRFVPGKKVNYTSDSPGGITPSVETFDARFYVTAPRSSNIDVHVAAGDDFQVYFWTGMPRVYVEDNPPAPAP